jgi:Uma2 family endonuclease
MSKAAITLDDFGRTDLRPLADKLLERTIVEYVDEGVLLIMNPPGVEHREIVRSIINAIHRASAESANPISWRPYSSCFQWELLDGSSRFYVPDVVVVHPDAQNSVEERAAIALVVEVTSPTSPDTVLNDRVTKPREYAKAGVPLYLLVDQEPGEWTLFALAEGWQRYQVAAAGKYGEPVPLPAPFGFQLATADWPRYQD